LPELPEAKRKRLISLGINQQKSSLLVFDSVRLNVFEILLEKSFSATKAADVALNASSEIIPDLDKVIAWATEKQTTAVEPDVINEVIKKVISDNPKAVADYKLGKEAALFFMVGQVKKQLGNIEVSSVLAIFKKFL
jgi:Asp-tRNA(Asn)/Glu-tRNA(Gln) amidotransferase B subunit